MTPATAFRKAMGSAVLLTALAGPVFGPAPAAAGPKGALGTLLDSAGDAGRNATRNTPGVHINPRVRSSTGAPTPNIAQPKISTPNASAPAITGPGTPGQVNILQGPNSGSVTDNLRAGTNHGTVQPDNLRAGPNYGSSGTVNRRPAPGEYVNSQGLLRQGTAAGGPNVRPLDGNYGNVGAGIYENPQDLLRGLDNGSAAKGARQANGSAASGYDNPADLLRGADDGYLAVNASDARRMLSDSRFRNSDAAARVLGGDYSKWPVPQLVPPRYAQIPPPRVSPATSKSFAKEFAETAYEMRKTIAGAAAVGVVLTVGTIYALDQSEALKK
jgi:hypothetical protein